MPTWSSRRPWRRAGPCDSGRRGASRTSSCARKRGTRACWWSSTPQSRRGPLPSRSTWVSTTATFSRYARPFRLPRPGDSVRQLWSSRSPRRIRSGHPDRVSGRGRGDCCPGPRQPGGVRLPRPSRGGRRDADRTPRVVGVSDRPSAPAENDPLGRHPRRVDARRGGIGLPRFPRTDGRLALVPGGVRRAGSDPGARLTRYGMDFAGEVWVRVTTVPRGVDLRPDDFAREGPSWSRLATLSNGTIFEHRVLFQVTP
mgnify:CR=1 FL=1